MYNKAFAHYGLDYAYLAFDVKEDGMEKAFEAIRLLNIKGGNFTTPCKVAAAKLVDKLSPAAQMVCACNALPMKMASSPDISQMASVLYKIWQNMVFL